MENEDDLKRGEVAGAEAILKNPKLPTPYYQDDYVTLYHADCREVLPLLEPVDLVLTDPPYGMEYKSNHRPKHQQFDKIQGDDKFPLWLFDELKPKVGMFVWCRWDNLYQLSKPKSFIVWDKGCHSMGDLKHEFGRQWEGCAFYPGPSHSFTHRPVDIIRVPRIASNHLKHPTEKPSKALTPLLQCHPVGTLLDPFAGSGSTLRAAKDLKWKAIGIEIEEKYCEVAANRLRQEVLGL
jgi:site-specific DNA-methyltransferase (adenine-specific)